MGKLSSAVKLGQTVVELSKNANTFAGNANTFAGNANTFAGNAKDFRAADKGEMGRQVGRHAFNEGAETGKTMGKTWLKTFEVIPRLVCRGLQFIFALIACGFYGNRVSADDDADQGFSPEWIFALLVAGLSAATSVAFLAVTPLGALPVIGSRLKLLKTYRAFAWDLILFVMWLVVFGIFAAIFLHRDGDDDSKRYKGSSTGAMKTAVWVDLVNAILWMGSGAYGATKVFLGERIDRATDKVGGKLFEKKKAQAKQAEYSEEV